jgi:hypothetical protein
MTRRTAARWIGAPVTAMLLVAGLAAAVGPDAYRSRAGAAVVGPSAEQLAPTEWRRGNPDAYRFAKTRSGRVVHWAHCRRINFRVNYDHAPNRSRWHVKEAVRRLKRATGLRYRYKGPTDVRPTPLGANYPRSTKLVVGWARPATSILKPGSAGVGGPAYNGRTGAIARGFVLINYKVRMAPGFGKGPRQGVQGTRGQVLMHELAHTVGLSHVRAEAQIMYRTATRKRATWGAGDWNGLRKQGRRAGCR